MSTLNELAQQINDNDNAGYTLVQSGGDTVVAEGGASETAREIDLLRAGQGEQ